MANSILKLKVESSEYDQKLANAAKGIRHLADVAHKGAGELTGLEKSEVDYIRALGEMETKSRTASGQVRELSSTYKELKVIYDQLNEVEKADEGGKALAASLETLRTRAQEAKTQLDSATISLNDNGEAGKGTSGILEVLKDKFTVNIDALTFFNKGLQVAEGALNVAKDAFFASEATVDEWGRIVDSSKSLYEGFLTALNTGDISGYLGRIDEIVQAARTAYNELDRLGTMKTIQAPKMSAQQTENERMRMMIQTGRYIAPVDGRRASMQNGQLLTPDQIKRIEQQLQGGMQKVVTLVGNEVAQTGKAIDAVYNRQAQELGLSLKEFRKGTSSMAEFDKRMAGYEQYQKWREQHTTIDMQSGREIVARGNPFEQYAKWGTFRVDGQRYNDLVRLIQQRDQQAGSLYGMQSQAYRTMNRAEGVTVSKLMRGEPIGGGGTAKSTNAKEVSYASDSIVAQQKLVQDLTKKWNEAGADVRDQYVKPLVEAEAKLRDMQSAQVLSKEQAQGKLLGNTPDGKAVEIPISSDIAFETWISGVKEKLADLKLDPIEIPIETTTKDVKAIAKAASTTADVVGSIGDAFNAIEDPAAKVMSTVAQAIATVALAYAQNLAKDKTTSGNIWAFIAAAAASTISMITTIASIHSATGYAEGGIIKGNSYSGDNIGGLVDGSQFVGLNAGEVVLNASQQNALAQSLQGGSGTVRVVGRVVGEDIFLSADRYARRSGRGSILTGKNL